MGMSSRQYSQMIPTPGFNNQGTISMNSEYSNGGGFVSTDSSTMSAQIQPQQQKQYAGNQSSHMMHLGGQIGAGMRSNLQQKPSSYGFSNGLMNGGLSLPGSNNQQLVNGPAASEGYMNLASYGSTPKPLQQNFNQQHPQQRIPSTVVLFNIITLASCFTRFSFLSCALSLCLSTFFLTHLFAYCIYRKLSPFCLLL